MKHTKENPTILADVGASKTFEPSQVEHLFNNLSQGRKQGVFIQIIGGVSYD